MAEVSIENALHRQLQELLERFAQYGVRVTDVRVEWNVARFVGGAEPQAHLRGIQVVTESL